jgi:hypothetical protein
MMRPDWLDGGMLLCSGTADLQLTCAPVAWDELKAGEQPGATAPRRFSMVAYTGQPMRFANLPAPVVVDLSTMNLGRGNQPILKDHSTGRVVGHATEVRVEGGQLRVAGVVSGAGPDAQEVIASSLNGFPWQASIGASYNRQDLELVKAGRTVEVNGRTFNGPVMVARNTQLREVSFVALGADNDTTAAVAAANDKEQDMQFSEWLKAKGFDEALLNSQTRAFLEAQFKAEQKAKEDKDEDPDAPELTASEQTELRLAGYRQVFSEPRHAQLLAQAIRERWSEDKCRLEAMRAERPAPTSRNPNTDPAEHQVIEAALAMSNGFTADQVRDLYRFDARTIDAASGSRYQRFGLQALCNAVIQAAGGSAQYGSFTEERIREAFRASASLQASTAGFTTISLPGILSNIANKRLLQFYQAIETVASLICASRPVSDFKTTTAYRLTAGGLWETVSAGGELKNGKLTEASYSNAALTYGQILTITRQMFVNDDLGAFLQITAQMGRLAALTRENAVFTTLLSNAGSFFATGNKNLVAAGASSALSIDSLTTAEALFLNQTDQNGLPVLVSPQMLLVPPALKVTAEKLYKDTMVNETTSANAPKGNSNPHAGRYRPIVSPFISNSKITNNSATRWYLMANPADVPALEIVYLNGREVPTIETGEVDFNTLGMAMRGYFDFGVAYQDPRGAVMSPGA